MTVSMSATTPDRDATPYTGWRLVGLATAAILLVQACVLGFGGRGEDGLRMAVRASARTSLLLFGASFVASSWWALRRDSVGRWLVKNRRHLGVSFAVSHAVHLADILSLLRVHHTEVRTLTLVVGGFGYLLVAAMAATSSDAAVRALGARAWKRLHGFGARYLWLVFFLTLLPHGRPRAIEGAMLVFVLAIAALRGAARWVPARSSAAI